MMHVLLYLPLFQMGKGITKRCIIFARSYVGLVRYEILLQSLSGMGDLKCWQSNVRKRMFLLQYLTKNLFLPVFFTCFPRTQYQLVQLSNYVEQPMALMFRRRFVNGWRVK